MIGHAEADSLDEAISSPERGCFVAFNSHWSLNASRNDFIKKMSSIGNYRAPFSFTRVTLIENSRGIRPEDAVATVGIPFRKERTQAKVLTPADDIHVMALGR
jgi:hypothetical protein